MKKHIKKILILILFYPCHLFAFFFPYSAVKYLKKIKTIFHGCWISSEFKSIGKFSSIGYPIYLHGGKYISIGEQVEIGGRGILTAWDSYRGDIFSPKIFIGNHTSIGDDFHITSINTIQIGNNVLLGKKVTITDNAHGTSTLDSLSLSPIERSLYSKGPVVIGDNVWIGDKATILPNVRIGKNAIIGANAVVTKDVPENSVVGGNPAIILKKIVTTHPLEKSKNEKKLDSFLMAKK